MPFLYLLTLYTMGALATHASVINIITMVNLRRATLVYSLLTMVEVIQPAQHPRSGANIVECHSFINNGVQCKPICECIVNLQTEMKI